VDRPKLEVADVFRRYGQAYREKHGGSMSTAQRRVMNAIEVCRTAALGGQIEQCDACGHQRICYRSCRNRHCPKCQSLARAEWIQRRQAELLDCEYFHVVFTVPEEIAAIAYQNKDVVYGILFRATAETLRIIAADPKHLGAEIGFFAVLHSRGSNLLFHPHLHCVVPGGGLSPDGTRWISCKPQFFLPVRVLSRLFRRLLLEHLQSAFNSGKLQFFSTLERLRNRGEFTRYLAPLRKAEWVVYAKPPFAGPEQVLDYVGRYTHRVCEPDGRNTYASESFLKLVGMTQEQCSNFGWGTVLHPEDGERTIPAWKECVRTEGQWSVEHRFLGVDGEWHPILARGVPVRDEQGSVVCWARINLDISALKRAEEETRRANEILEAFFAASPAILNIEDEDLRYLKTHALTASYFGLSRDEIVGRRLSDLAPDFIREFGPLFHEVLETGRPRLNMEVWAGVPGRNMGVRHWLASYFAVPLPEGKRGLGVVGIDITENKRAEERLRQAQRLESLGRLAGGLAHDFNNLMNVMIIYADSALDELQAGESATQSVTEIRHAAEKAVEMGRQLMAFSSSGTSKQEIQLEVLNLNPVFGNSEKMLRRLIGEDVKIIFQPAAGLRSVKADRGQLTQILMNLTVNARDAMPEGGTLVIKTENVELDPADPRLDPGASPGAYVLLTVRDTGMGMDKVTQARIFEPFFTTKDVGKGTGLGLSVVYGIVRQNGGFITVASEPGRGTEFKIYLPAVAEAAEPVRDGQAARVAGGSETILLVEDETALRKKLHQILVHAGYHVLAAPDGGEAFRLSLTETRAIHLLLTDIDRHGYACDVGHTTRQADTRPPARNKGSVRLRLPGQAARRWRPGSDRSLPTKAVHS